MKWLIELLIRSKRLRGLSESQLKDLIDTAKDTEALKLLKEHLQTGDFKYVHIEQSAPALIERCTLRAWEIYEHTPELKEKFINEILDKLELLP